MDADKCQEDLNTMSEQLQSSMEKMVVTEPAEPEKSPLAVEEPELAAVNGRHEAEPSPVDDQQTNVFPAQVPETGAQSEDSPVTKPDEPLLVETAERDMPPDVSEKVEEPAPEKVSAAPEQDDVSRDSLEKVEEPMEVEEPSEATQHPPEAFPEPASPSNATPAELESLHLEQQPAVEGDPEPKVVAPQSSPQPGSLVPLVEEAVHKQEAPTVEVAMATAEPVVEVVSAIEPPKEKAVEEVLGKDQDVQMESPVESKLVREVCSEAPVQAEAVQPTEAEAVKEEETKTPAEPDLTAAAAMAQVEQKEATVDQMEPTQEPDPAPGSLAFALLEDEQTKAAFRTSRTLVVLRGLPGSGKSFLARAIADSYQNLCSVVHSDDHDGDQALDEALIACCSATSGPSVVVVDDTNHTHDRLARLAEIADQNHRVALFLEPGTEWCRDVAQLVTRTTRGLEEAQLQAMKVLHVEVDIPLFFGWFLLHDKIKCTAADFLKTLDSLGAFKKHLADFPVETEKEVDLEQYFHSNWQLHCTTKYCDYGKANGAKEYTEETAVKKMCGFKTELSLTALFVTPRTFGARVSLSEAQLALWPADAQEEDESTVPGAGALPPGSRAHISLGCTEKVKPVQTGLDLLDILVLQQAGQQGELVEEMELGSLVYLEKGRWLLTLREPVSVSACFSGKYKPKKIDATKKDPEKKKKPKCSIL